MPSRTVDESTPNYWASSYNRFDGTPPRPVTILDSTLREGEQAAGVSFTVEERLRLARDLDRFGVNAIEISPVVSAEHGESCRKMVQQGLRAAVVAHLRALPEDIDVALDCDAEWIALYHSVSDFQLESKLHVSREKALERCVKAVEYAKAHGLKLRFTLEDASRAEPSFLSLFARSLAEAGADRLSVPDTLGLMLPRGMTRLVQTVRQAADVPIDVHCHNDLGLALANSLAGYEAGASQIHATINGLGERVGITSLAEVAVALAFLYGVNLDLRLEMLSELSHSVESITRVPVPLMKPLVGRNAYKHKAGTHIAGLIHNVSAYEGIPPDLVGNIRSVVFGQLSGRNGAALLLRLLGLPSGDEESRSLALALKKSVKGDVLEVELPDGEEPDAFRAGATGT